MFEMDSLPLEHDPLDLTSGQRYHIKSSMRPMFAVFFQAMQKIKASFVAAAIQSPDLLQECQDTLDILVNQHFEVETQKIVKRFENSCLLLSQTLHMNLASNFPKELEKGQLKEAIRTPSPATLAEMMKVKAGPAQVARSSEENSSLGKRQISSKPSFRVGNSSSPTKVKSMLDMASAEGIGLPHKKLKIPAILRAHSGGQKQHPKPALNQTLSTGQRHCHKSSRSSMAEKSGQIELAKIPSSIELKSGNLITMEDLGWNEKEDSTFDVVKVEMDHWRRIRVYSTAYDFILDNDDKKTLVFKQAINPGQRVLSSVTHKCIKVSLISTTQGGELSFSFDKWRTSIVCQFIKPEIHLWREHLIVVTPDSILMYDLERLYLTAKTEISLEAIVPKKISVDNNQISDYDLHADHLFLTTRLRPILYKVRLQSLLETKVEAVQKEHGCPIDQNSKMFVACVGNHLFIASKTTLNIFTSASLALVHSTELRGEANCLAKVDSGIKSLDMVCLHLSNHSLAFVSACNSFTSLILKYYKPENNGEVLGLSSLAANELLVFGRHQLLALIQFKLNF